MSKYEFTKGNGDTVTCDDCNEVVGMWWSDTHAICDECHSIRTDKGVCADCGLIVDFNEDGGHIYSDGSVTCPDCEGKNE
jgi:hypothetical protein